MFLLVHRPSLLVDCCRCVTATVFVVLTAAAAACCCRHRVIVSSGIHTQGHEDNFYLGWCCSTSAFLRVVLVAGQQRLARLQRRIDCQRCHAPHCCLQQSSNVIAEHVVATLGGNATMVGIVTKCIVNKHDVVAKCCVIAKQGDDAERCVPSALSTSVTLLPSAASSPSKATTPSVVYQVHCQQA